MNGDVRVVGVGMHPWGKWGRNFVGYGVVAAEDALRDAAIDWCDVDFLAGAATVRNGYPGYVAGATLSQALGWHGNAISSNNAACASGTQALDAARMRILAGASDIALVVGADTTPKGFLAPVGGDRWRDADWLRYRLLGATNPTYFALLARRRMHEYGTTTLDLAAVKAKNSRAGSLNPNARYRKIVGVDEVMSSPIVSDPLRLLDICATSDGAAAVVLASPAVARRIGRRDSVRLRAVATPTPVFPHTMLEIPDIATDSTRTVPDPECNYLGSLARQIYGASGVEPADIDVAEVYDLTTAMELDWYEHLGLCAEGDAEQLLRTGATALGGRIPVNPSGGLASFGEAVPAQALAQVCELVWQLRGQAGARQVEGAKVGIAANKGLLSHASAVVLTT